VLAACQGAKRPAGRRIGVITSSGGLAELILDIAASADLLLPPLSAAAKAEIESRIGFVTGDGNPLDAWGNGTFVANLPHALGVFERSPDHDIVVFCRDNCDDQPFEMPELPWSYLELFVRAAASSSKPHYLLHTRPGVMNREQVAHLRAAGIPVVGGIREGLGAIDQLAQGAV
jgi:acetate---CoA ligase (ADP-forming)